VDRMRAMTPAATPSPTPPMVNGPAFDRCRLGVIGASTGGPAAVQRILQGLPEALPFPLVVVQHMPAGFTRPFAERLASLSRLRVVEAEDGLRLSPGMAVIARAGAHLRVSSSLSLTLSLEPRDARHVPSVDVTMRSAARAHPGAVLGVLLTGMGEDGAEGLTAIRASGGVTIAQSEASCVVYGMPRAAVLRGGAAWVLSLDEIAELLSRAAPGPVNRA
jgi:two-component system chemotaxis response regulator CheB